MERTLTVRNMFLLWVAFAASSMSFAQPSKVELVSDEKGFTLLKDSEPYYIKGAGAKSHFGLLANSGANSIRVWSTNNEAYLDSAHAYNMTVALGLYVRPERSGMDYNNEYAVQSQIEQLKTEVLKYKDHPALLVWGIGNEVDLQYSNFKVWETIEVLAKFIKEVDKNHPTMTVIAGLDPSKIYMIKKHCPSVDILGLNAYGSIENAPLNIRKYNWDKPYIVSEWGVNGPFEAPRTAWQAKKEPPNGVKANQRIRRYQQKIESDSEMCLGSYCFLWGQKQESTATWHGIFLNSGYPTEAVDAMHYCWTGSWPEERAPSIVDIKLEGTNWKKDHFLSPNREVTLDIDVNPNNNSEIMVEFHLFPESMSKKVGGDIQKSLDEIELNIVRQSISQVTFLTPKFKGAYRIFAYVKNKNNQSSVANVPFFVE